MNYEAFLNAIAAAARFLAVARTVRTEPNRYGKTPRMKVVNNTKETAACKRASLDLTRALSELRANK